MEMKEKAKEKQTEIACADKRCPVHGGLKVRGRYFEGYVEKIVGRRAVVKWERINYVPKYERYHRTYSKLHAYVPTCISINKGDLVKIGECRPLSKIMHFVIMEVKKQ
jgi:small subunit ribosomal protein S17